MIRYLKTVDPSRFPVGQFGNAFSSPPIIYPHVHVVTANNKFFLPVVEPFLTHNTLTRIETQVLDILGSDGKLFKPWLAFVTQRAKSAATELFQDALYGDDGTNYIFGHRAVFQVPSFVLKDCGAYETCATLFDDSSDGGGSCSSLAFLLERFMTVKYDDLSSWEKRIFYSSLYPVNTATPRDDDPYRENW